MRPLGLVLALLLTAMNLLLGSPLGTAHAADPEGLVQIEFTKVNTTSLSSTGTVQLEGKVTNTSGRAMRQVQVLFWRSSDPITDPSDLNVVLQSNWDSPIGERVSDPSENLFNITSDQSPQFAAGATSTFTVKATPEQLGLHPADRPAAYLLGVHVRAQPEGSTNQTVGRGRLLLPWVDTSAGAKAPQARLAPIVAFTAAPARNLDGALMASRLPDLHGLMGLLDVAERPGTMVLVDPELIDVATLMVKGFTRTDGSTADSESDEAQTASTFLTRLDAVLKKQRSYRLPYGNPDVVTALSTAPMGQWAGADLPKDHRLADLPLALWAPAGLPSRLVSRAKALNPGLLLVPGVGSHVEQSAATTTITYDPQLSAGGPGPTVRASQPQRLGRLLSQLVVSNRAYPLIVSDPSQAQLLRSLPGWVGSADANALPSGQLPASSATPTRSPLFLEQLGHRVRQLDAWANLLGWTSAAPIQQVALGTLSRQFDQPEATSYLDQATASLPASPESIDLRLTMADSFVMNEAKSVLPATVTNNSPFTVQVKVMLRSDNPARIDAPETQVVRLRPKESASVNFTPEATTNGVVGFEAQLASPDGHRLGTAHRFSINATSFGRVGWVIIIASGVVVLAGTAWRIKQVQRERSQAAATTPPPPPVDEQRADITNRPHP